MFADAGTEAIVNLLGSKKDNYSRSFIMNLLKILNLSLSGRYEKEMSRKVIRFHLSCFKTPIRPVN